MLSWMVACSSIAGLSVVALELFRESPSSLRSELKPINSGSVGWTDMTDSDLDALVNEFCEALEQRTAEAASLRHS